MPRPKSPTLTDGELRLMRVLWERGEATAADIVSALKGRPKPAYNSVLTVLRILEKKGYITHRKDGRAFMFMPVIDKQDASRSALKTLVNRFFDGSPGVLILNLLEDEELPPEALERLKARIGEGS
jgi:BlaI family transcriptional regulator, penicillinase repressor